MLYSNVQKIHKTHAKPLKYATLKYIDIFNLNNQIYFYGDCKSSLHENGS